MSWCKDVPERDMSNLVGQTFGRLTVVKQKGRNRWGQALIVCRCSCGKDAKVRVGNLVAGNSRSCGCLKSETSRARFASRKVKSADPVEAWLYKFN